MAICGETYHVEIVKALKASFAAVAVIRGMFFIFVLLERLFILKHAIARVAR